MQDNNDDEAGEEEDKIKKTKQTLDIDQWLPCVREIVLLVVVVVCVCCCWKRWWCIVVVVV